MTDFPTKGDDKAVSLRNSNFERFDRAFAERLKANEPNIWGAGGNIRGNDAFKLWGRAIDGDDAKAVTDWIREREAWAARHREDGKQFPNDNATKSNIAGVVAAIKWGVVLDIGQKVMKDAVREAVDNQRDDNAHKKNHMENTKEQTNEASDVVERHDEMSQIVGATERRFQSTGGLSLRDYDDESGERRVEGYAAVFNSETDIGGFAEVIAPTAFEGRLDDPVVAVFNHNQLQPLAKVGAGLELSVDERGLRYSFPIPDTTAGRDLIELMERGIVRDASFAFMLGSDGDSWESREGAKDLRTIHRVARLVDVSVVTVGAYSDASSVLRSFDAITNPEPKPEPCPSCDCQDGQCEEPQRDERDNIQSNGAKIRSAVIKHRIEQIRKTK